MEVKVGQSFVGCYQKKSSGSESVMAFCPVCLGILLYSWQNTSRNVTCEQQPRHIFFDYKLFPIIVKFCFLWYRKNERQRMEEKYEIR